MDIEQTHSQEREAASELSKGVGRPEPRKRPDEESIERQGHEMNKKKPGYNDVEIDRRAFNGHTIVLLEDRTKGMMKSDGTSYQYTIAVARVSKDGKLSLIPSSTRSISDLMIKQGYANAYEAARAIFLNLEAFKGILGERWIGYEAREMEQAARPQEKVTQFPLFGS